MLSSPAALALAHSSLDIVPSPSVSMRSNASLPARSRCGAVAASAAFEASTKVPPPLKLGAALATPTAEARGMLSPTLAKLEEYEVTPDSMPGGDTAGESRGSRGMGIRDSGEVGRFGCTSSTFKRLGTVGGGGAL